MRKLLLAALATLAAIDIATPVCAQPAARLADRDIVEAYEYMLGRLLVLRQENLDFKEGFKWNEITHRAPGGVDWANPIGTPIVAAGNAGSSQQVRSIASSVVRQLYDSPYIPSQDLRKGSIALLDVFAGA